MGRVLVGFHVEEVVNERGGRFQESSQQVVNLIIKISLIETHAIFRHHSIMICLGYYM